MRYLVFLLALNSTFATATEFELRFHDQAADRIELQNAMLVAADAWAAVLKDPILIVVDVRIVPVHELGFAQAAAYRVAEVVPYSELRAALAIDASSVDDNVAVAHLSQSDQLTFRMMEATGETIINRETEGINGWLDVPRANAKALGIPVSGGANDADGEIEWNEAFLSTGILDLDRSDGISGTDFVSVAIHELGHLLGFISGVDDFDEIGQFDPTNLREIAILNVPDLFRYTTDSLPHIDLVPGGLPYFSIDGGRSAQGAFATGIFQGDGIQAGHWKGGQGVMDGQLADDIAVPISVQDLRLLDIIGWDIDRPLVAEDIDLLMSAIHANASELGLDYDASGKVDANDLSFLVHNRMQTVFGDANLDYRFDSEDLVHVFEAGQHEDAIGDNSTWATGDWNADGEFTIGDLVAGFEDGGYEKEACVAAKAVPEPPCWLTTFAGLSTIIVLCRSMPLSKRR